MLAINTTLQIILLRSLMSNESLVGKTKLGAYIIPLNDAHQGTRVPACAARLHYISGFSGSSGTVVVTATKALLWTDGRYFTQAAAELDNNWTLMKEGLHDTPTIPEYLRTLGSGAMIGVDPSLYGVSAWTQLEANLKNANQKLHGVAVNLVDKAWDEIGGRPACPTGQIQNVPANFTGLTVKDKLAAVRAKMAEKKVVGVVLVQLDDIAWLLNLRGFDIPSAALFLSFAIVKENGFELFVDLGKINDQIKTELKQDGGVIYDYTQVNTRLESLVNTTNGSVLLDKLSSFSLVNIVPEARRVVELSPVVLLKSVKNPTQIAGVKNALIRDAGHLARLYAWLENAVHSGENVTELTVSDKLMSFRNESKEFMTTSFATIAGVDGNGAIIHYRPVVETNKQVGRSSMILIDAGSTYTDGTTDITRTFHFGTPTDHQQECYTRVLKGQIAVATSIFPAFTKGNRLDSFARKFLWEVGLDYGHGTGHGIGINVHEGPSRITYSHDLAPDDQGLRENMLTSNEPGYYEEGAFGIRLENIVRVVNSSKTGTNKVPFLEIEDLTFLPYQHKLIKTSLLNKKEIDYLNKYQEKVRSIVGEYLKANYPSDPANAWIIKETTPFTAAF